MFVADVATRVATRCQGVSQSTSKVASLRRVKVQMLALTLFFRRVLSDICSNFVLIRVEEVLLVKFVFSCDILSFTCVHGSVSRES